MTRRSVRTIRQCALALVLGCAVVVTGAGAGFAHGDEGLLELEASAGREPLTVDVRARLVYANDRDPVSGATVTLDGVGPSGATLAPAPMTSAGDGIYTATVRLPSAGAWKLNAVAITPSAVAEIGIDTVQPATTTTTQPNRGGEPRGPIATEEDGSGDGFLVVAVIVGVLILGGGMIALFVQRSRRRGSTTS